MKFSEYFSFCEIVTYKEHLIFLQISNRNDFFQSELKLFYFLDLRKLQYQVKKAFSYKKLFWPFTVWINCSSDLKTFTNSWPSASNFKSFSRSLEQFFLTVGQNNFSNKIPILHAMMFLLDISVCSWIIQQEFPESTATKVRLFLDRSCSIFSWLKFIVVFSWFYILNEIESTENRATAI